MLTKGADAAAGATAEWDYLRGQRPLDGIGAEELVYSVHELAVVSWANHQSPIARRSSSEEKHPGDPRAVRGADRHPLPALAVLPLLMRPGRARPKGVVIARMSPPETAGMGRMLV